MGALIKPGTPVINWNNPITKGLVFDVPMFERGGLQAVDLVTRVNGAVTGATWQSSLHGPVLNFTAASNHYIDYGRPQSLILNRNFSIMALVNWATNSVERSIISYSDGSWFFRIDLNGKFDLVDSQTSDVLAGTTTTSANTWNSGAVTIDGSATANITMYTNGVKDGTATYAGAFNDSTNNLRIGAEYNNGVGVPEEYFDGKISCVRVWKRVLSNQEVRQLHANPWQIYRTPYTLFKRTI